MQEAVIIATFVAYFALVVLCIGLMAAQVYGVYLAFKAHFVLGLLSFVLPFLFTIYGVSKLVFKTDLAEIIVNQARKMFGSEQVEGSN